MARSGSFAWRKALCGVALFAAVGITAPAAEPPSVAEPRLIIFDNDFNGPATTNLQAALVLLQNPKVKILGFTVVSGDQWRDENVAHTLRLLELVGRTDIPVVPGALHPLINSEARHKAWEQSYGKKSYKGAWNYRTRIPHFKNHAPTEVPPLIEGKPTTKPSSQIAAMFLIEQVRKYPNQITILAGGPHTNLALAIKLDPEFPYLAKELVFMGATMHPHIDWPSLQPGAEFPPDKFPLIGKTDRDYNLWWDPEAAHIVLNAPWRRITALGDVVRRTRMTADFLSKVTAVKTPITDYIGKYTMMDFRLADEVTAAVAADPTLIKKTQAYAMDVDIDRGMHYGVVTIWDDTVAPNLGEEKVQIVTDFDLERFEREFISAMQAPTPPAH